LKQSERNWQEPFICLPQVHAVGCPMHTNIGTTSNAMPFYESAPDDPSVELVMVCKKLGESYWRQNKLNEALAGYEHAVEIGTMTGDKSPNAAKVLVNLAKIYSLQGQFEKAHDGLERAVALYTEALGDDHPDVADSLFTMGCVCESMGRLDNALEHHTRALELRLVFLGKGHPQVGMSCSHIASTQMKLGNLEVAHERYQEALAIFIASVGPQHVFVAATLCSVAELHVKQDRPEQAMDCYKHALENRIVDVGADHHSLVSLHHDLGKLLE